MSCTALIVAGGRGKRFGTREAKQFQRLGDRPLIAWTLEAFDRCPAIDSIVLVSAPDHRQALIPLVDSLRLDTPIQLADGGAERQDSVRAGLEAVADEAHLVAIHDGARPLVTPELIARVVDAAAARGAAIPALPVHDTIKRGADGRVIETVDRRQLHSVQTPQVFTLSLIRRAMAAHGVGPGPVTDDSQLVERLGHPVALVPGDPGNIKITVPEDLRLAEFLLGCHRERKRMRVGNGHDVHRLVPGRRLMLGGVRLEHPRGLLGHSDADVLCHAAGDALLGAAGLGDLGTHFPDEDDRWRDLSGMDLLERIMAIVRAAGYGLGNLDVTVICERPRLNPHVPRMRRNVARALGARMEHVNIKATTTEGLGSVGREEGIAAQATVLLEGLEEQDE